MTVSLVRSSAASAPLHRRTTLQQRRRLRGHRGRKWDVSSRSGVSRGIAALFQTGGAFDLADETGRLSRHPS